MLLYDNLDDVKGKLVNTFCYYDGKAVIVKDAQLGIDEKTGKSMYILAVFGVNSRNMKMVRLDDPAFNYMKFNIGYTNHIHSAAWWYRIPAKQFRQGLKQDQMGRNASRPDFVENSNFQFGRQVADMMENNYPKFESAEETLKRQEAHIVAFHKDFAATWDDIHRDLIVEYKGKRIGCMDGSNSFKLLDEYKHLTEALKEAVA